MCLEAYAAGSEHIWRDCKLHRQQEEALVADHSARAHSHDNSQMTLKIANPG